ncbi:neutral/alkaline non-lysosomal ceramidase N-terminal domain-containing protein [bacterium]|nr:neutral/alkaline non-lysosomal ceramidase N-terminal domain-containing protein [bacterium]
MGKILIGWGEKDITPNEKVNLFGHFAERVTDKVRDPITATALFIGDGKDYAIMVSCDVCIIAQDVIDMCRKELKKEVPEIDTKKVIFNATHTHDAPGVASWIYPPVPKGVMSPEEYSVFFKDRVVEAIKEAWVDKKSGGVSWAYGQAVVGHSRRTCYFEKSVSKKSAPGVLTEGYSVMYGKTDNPNFSHFEGYVDHGVDILFTFDSKKKLTGVIVNIACTSQETEGLMEISADFWHETRNELRKKFGKNLKVLPQCAAAGDLSPHLLIEKKANDRMLKLKGIDMRQEIANRLSYAVEEVYPYARKDIKKDLPFKHKMKKVKLQRRQFKKEEIKILKEDYKSLLAKKSKSHNEKYVNYIYLKRCEEALNRYELQKTEPEYSTEVHTVRIGDIVIATNQFELYLDFGLRIKARSPFVQTFIVQLSGAGTYVPTEKGLLGKGYSASVYDSIVGPEGGQQLVEETLKLMK